MFILTINTKLTSKVLQNLLPKTVKWITYFVFISPQKLIYQNNFSTVQENFFTKSPGTVHWFWAPACGPGIRTWVLSPQGVAGFTVYNCKISKYLSGDKLTHHQYFKGTVSRAFKLCFFHDSNPPEPVIHMLKYFRIFRDILHMQKTALCL